jgi:transposase
MTRLYGRAPRGERVVGTVPQNYGANVTMLAALGSHGVEAVMTIDGATDAEVFRAYVPQVLRPTLRPGDLVRMDNRRAHKAAGIREAIAQAGAQVLYLPPYAPDLSPIEPCWSKLKTALRAAKARPREALEHAIVQALATITVADAHSCLPTVAMPYNDSRTAIRNYLNHRMSRADNSPTEKEGYHEQEESRTPGAADPLGNSR